MDIKTMQMMIASLCNIKVSGKDNLALLLGCITTLENAVKAESEKQEGKGEKK